MMAATGREIPLVVEQIVPSPVCFACEVCCRFPEVDSPLRPYFTQEEIRAALAHGIAPDAFPDQRGSKVSVVPYGDGYICPAFDPTTGRCGIYQARPLDCRLYPIAVMWDQTHTEVVMGWDSKCPFILDNRENPESRAYVERMAAFLESEAVAATFIANPQLVGSFQEDVVILRCLNRITAWLRPPHPRPLPPGERVRKPRAAIPETSLLTLTDRRWLESLLHTYEDYGAGLAAYSFPYHFVWQGLFRYEWMELEGHHCLLAGNQDGSFWALPPLGPDPCGPVVPQAFAFLADRNRIPALSRIENVPERMAAQYQAQGYRVVSKGPDYVYRRADLVALQGDRYKGQRAAYNHCVKHTRPVYRSYRPEDREACLAVFRQWRAGICEAEPTGLARYMAADAESAHHMALLHASALGLVGRVVDVEGRVAGYTFGYPLTPSVFCILFEIADRQVKGLAQYIFREFCRELESYEFINTLDDSGLDGLRRAKLAYHPIRLVESYIVSSP